MIKRTCYVIGVILLMAACAFAQNDNVGTSAANFLKIGVGSRAVAMGEAFVAHANDVTALYWNPAGIAGLEGTQVGFALTDWVLDINHSFVGVTHNLGNIGTVGVSFNYLTMGEMEKTTASEPHGTGAYFDCYDMAIGVAYARQLTDRFSVGLQVKYIQETISFSKAGTIALDVGTQFITGFHGMRIGMSVSNFGGKMMMYGTDQLTEARGDEEVEGTPDKTARLETEAWPVPMMFRFGVSMDVMKTDKNILTVNADLSDPRDVAPMGNFGFEYGFNNFIYLRGGLVYRPESYDEAAITEDRALKLNYEVKLSFGGGISMKIPGLGSRMKIDYAYVDLGVLTTSHRFSFLFEI